MAIILLEALVLIIFFRDATLVSNLFCLFFACDYQAALNVF